MNKILISTLYLLVFLGFTNLISAQNETNETIICGNGVCEFNESLSCPSDCDNCSEDLECDDGDSCTIDTCEGTPKNCVYIEKDCNDNNPATIDKCIEGKCTHPYTTECINGDGYCPEGCNNIDSDCPKKDSCTSIDDCNDDNPCTKDLCEGKPKRCNHLPNDGIRKDNKYCYGESWRNQKVDRENCDEDYECISNSCAEGKCTEKEVSWLERYIPWLYKILKALHII